MDILYDLDKRTSINSRQLEILIELDFFSDFGNQRELLRMVDLFNMFKKGEAKQIRKHVPFIDIRGGMELDPKVKNLTASQFQAIYDEWLAACGDAEDHYFKMLELGATPQIARSVLNNSTKTEICVTMNLREWRHFFRLRTGTPAHPQMREVTIPLLREFQRRIPVVFDDIKIPEDTREGAV